MFGLGVRQWRLILQSLIYGTSEAIMWMKAVRHASCCLIQYMYVFELILVYIRINSRTYYAVFVPMACHNHVHIKCIPLFIHVLLYMCTAV